MNLSLKESISALYVCADILEYPIKNYLDIVSELSHFTNTQTEQFDLEFIESEYIRIFNMNSSKLKTVPYASWWIDGRLGGKTLSKISDFYRDCGYEIDMEVIKKPIDHISLMITFVAILAEENRFEEIKKFAKFLTWLNDFANSLDNSTKVVYFRDAVNIASGIINSFKEKL